MKQHYDILEIEITNDKKIVKRAYSKMVKKYNPERNPLEFQKIRESYDKINEFISNGGFKEGELPTSINSSASLENKYIEKAKEFIVLKQYKKAIFAYEQELKAEKYKSNYKEKSEIINAIGHIYVAKKEFSKAIDKFKESLKIYSDSDSTYSNLADAYKQLEDYENAIDNYKKANKLAPNNNEYIKSILDIYIETKESDKLMQELKRYKLSAKDKIKYYVAALNTSIKKHIEEKTSNTKEIDKILDIIIVNYTKVESQVADYMAKELFVIINELCKNEHYDLAEKLIKTGKTISNKKIFDKLDSSIKGKKKELEVTTIDDEIITSTDDESESSSMKYAFIAIVVFILAVTAMYYMAQ